MQVRMIALRPLLCSVLALVLVLSAVATASARGAMAAEGLICGSGELRIVIAADGLPLFDGDGAPVERTLPCFDCVLAAAALPVPQALPGVTSSVRTLAPVALATPVPQVWRMGGKGRSPPGTT
jgi:hypothetical protein